MNVDFYRGIAAFFFYEGLRVKRAGKREEKWNARRDRNIARHVPIIRNDTKKNIRVRENLIYIGYIRISVPSTQRVQSGKRKREKMKKKK